MNNQLGLYILNDIIGEVLMTILDVDEFEEKLKKIDVSTVKRIEAFLQFTGEDKGSISVEDVGICNYKEGIGMITFVFTVSGNSKQEIVNLLLYKFKTATGDSFETENKLFEDYAMEYISEIKRLYGLEIEIVGNVDLRIKPV